jgi:hypothetical protein
MTGMMTYSAFDMLYAFSVLLICTIVYAIVKGWYDNRKWEKHIYQILEQYRAKYGKDPGCELLIYKEVNDD